MRSLLGNRRYQLALLVVIAFAVADFLLSMFVRTEGDFAFDMNTIIPIVWGMLVIFLLARLLNHERENKVSGRVYSLLLWGLVLWVLGDLIYGVYVFVFHNNDPFPSWADFTWLIGYPFLILGLYHRIRSYGVPLVKRDRWVLSGLLVLLLLVIVGYILVPILRDYDPLRLGESILNILYPVFDSITLILTLIILFTLEKGKFAQPWAVITAAFVFSSVADLMFYQASWAGTYYPGDVATAYSILIDCTYNLLYPFLCLGFYMVYDLVSERAGISERLAAERTPDLPKVSFEIFTDAQEKIISFSENLLHLLKTRDRSQISGAPFDRVLGIEQGDLQNLRRSLNEQGFLREFRLSVADSAGQRIETWLTGFALHDPRGAPNGANFVLQAEVQAGFAGPQLTKESALYVSTILEQAGILEKERRETRTRGIRSHFQVQLELLYALITSESNHRVAQTMEIACQQLAKDRGWPIQFEEGKTTVAADSDTAILEEAYPQVLAVAREHAVRVLGEDLVRAELAKLDRGSPGLIEI